MDKEKLSALLDSVYELEGLIHLALSRDDNTEHLKSLIARKSALVAENSDFLVAVRNGVEPEPSDEYPEPLVSIIPSEEPEPIAEIDEEPEVLAPFGVEEESVEEEEVPEDVAEEEAEIASAVEAPIEQVETPAMQEIIEDKLAEAEEETVEAIVEEIAKESLAVKPTTRGRLVFTLNDKFRFKRELFGNSDEAFNQALGLVAEMESYDEAEDYFLAEMQWNPERDEVKEFLEILKRYFR